jgi:hypothetical protein
MRNIIQTVFVPLFLIAPVPALAGDVFTPDVLTPDMCLACFFVDTESGVQAISPDGTADCESFYGELCASRPPRTFRTYVRVKFLYGGSALTELDCQILQDFATQPPTIYFGNYDSTTQRWTFVLNVPRGTNAQYKVLGGRRFSSNTIFGRTTGNVPAEGDIDVDVNMSTGSYAACTAAGG